jgi:SAM-dependent methyltransferase
MMFDTYAYRDQFFFQARYVRGRALNVGCNTDGAEIGKRHGCVNVDVLAEDYQHEKLVKLPVHVLGDARALPFADDAFDSVVLGEILEHMTERPAVETMKEACRVIRKNGRAVVVITMPHDNRRDIPGNTEPVGRMYAPGVYAYHHTLITREELFQRMEAAGLEPLVVGTIRYSWGFDYRTGEHGCIGTGVVATC